MRERVSRDKKTTKEVSIPSLKNPVRGFGLDTPDTAPRVVPDVQPLNKPPGHHISRISVRPQAKLTVNQPGDIFEQEADRVAQQVIGKLGQPGNSPRIQREQMPEEEEELQIKPLTSHITPLVQRQEMPEEEELQMKPLDITTLQREEIPEEEEELQMSPMVQRQANAEMAAAPDLETSINQARGGGQPMADNIRKPMEQAFGADFSGVKVHTDGQSDQLNRSIQARAFTTGQDVFFRQGEYNPGSRGGQELLAHELTHVVQQSGGEVMRSHFNYPVQTTAFASYGGMGLVQRYPHPPGLADTLNYYKPQEKSKYTQFTEKTARPTFGAKLYTAVINTYQGGEDTTTVTGSGSMGSLALTRMTTQLDHEPSWSERRQKIIEYGMEMTKRGRLGGLTREDIALIDAKYYILDDAGNYVPTLYSARMYYNDFHSLKPTAGGENSSAGASSVRRDSPLGTLPEELRKDYVIRHVGDYGLQFNEGLDIEDGGTLESILSNLDLFIRKLNHLKTILVG